MNSNEGNRLFDEAISDAREYLPRLKEGLTRVVVLLQEGKEGEGISLFLESIEGMEWFGTVLGGANSALNTLPGDTKLKGMSSQYERILTDLLSAWENRDMVLIGDLIEFELAPLIEQFLDAVSQGREH